MKKLMIVFSLLGAVQLHGQEKQQERDIRIVYCMTICPMANSTGQEDYKERSRDKYQLSANEIKKLPYTEVNDMISTMTGVYQRRRGAELSVSGSREGDVTYIVDGMHILRQ